MKNLPIKLTLVGCFLASLATAQLPQGLLFQNAIPLPKNEVYWQNGLGVWNQINYAVTDKISLGQGIMPLNLWGDAFVYTVSGKFSAKIPNRKIYAGLGVFHAAAFYNGWENGWFIPYGVVTLGSPLRQINFIAGANFGYFPISGEHHFEDDAGAPLPFFGLSTQLSRRGYVSVIFDSYWHSISERENFLIAMPGIRFCGRRFGLDLSLGGMFDFYYGFDEPDFYPLPWASFFVGLTSKSRCSWHPKN